MDMNSKKGWSASTKIIVTVLLILGTLWLLITSQPVLTALVIAGLLAYLFDPLSKRLSKGTRLSRAGAARMIFLVLIVVLATIPAMLGAIVVEQFNRLESEFINAIIAIETWASQPIQLLGYRIYPEALVNNLEQAAGSVLGSIPGESINLLSGFTTNLLWVLLLFFSLYYLLVDGHQIVPWLIQRTPTEYQEDFRKLLDELDEVWAVFLRVQILMFFVLGFLMGTGFLLVIWLFRSGLIPFSPLLLILLVVLVVTIAQQIDNLWLRPQLMGKSLRMHPGLVFVGLTGALMVGGLLAAFFIVPLMGTAKVLGHYIYCRLFDLPPWPGDEDSDNVEAEKAAKQHAPNKEDEESEDEPHELEKLT
jgi:predicted PurR-regulated permease PerM